MISIDAPMKGAARSMLKLLKTKIYFNPRTHEGCGRLEYGCTTLGDRISIHAPMKGAAVKIAKFLTHFSNFTQIYAFSVTKQQKYSKVMLILVRKQVKNGANLPRKICLLIVRTFL